MNDFLQAIIIGVGLGLIVVAWPRLAGRVSNLLRRVGEGSSEARVSLVVILALLGAITGLLINYV